MDQREHRAVYGNLEKGKLGEPYSVGPDIETTIADLAHSVRDLISPHKQVLIEKRNTTNNIRNRYVLPIEKAHINLGLKLRLAYTTPHSMRLNNAIPWRMQLKAIGDTVCIKLLKTLFG